MYPYPISMYKVWSIRNHHGISPMELVADLVSNSRNFTLPAGKEHIVQLLQLLFVAWITPGPCVGAQQSRTPPMCKTGTHYKLNWENLLGYKATYQGYTEGLRILLDLELRT